MAKVIEYLKQANLGWQYYKKYYGDNPNKDTLADRNETILQSTILKSTILKSSLKETDGFDLQGCQCKYIRLKTTYPGLLIGSGYIHEAVGSKKVKDEAFKIGFFFDHVTGMPYIPGSSVKGVLRAAFPLKDKDRYGEEKSKYIKGICGDSTDVETLRDCIFEGEIDGKQLPIYRRDIFHDAYFSKSNAKDLFLGTDYITPHKDNPLKNPQPIKFLKILPEVEITFRFELRDEIIKAMDKFKLFRQILLDFGVGAKTNVGYGQLRRTHRHFKITQAEFRCRRQDQCRVRAVKGS